MVRIPTLAMVSQEAIDYQKKKSFFGELIGIYRDFQEANLEDSQALQSMASAIATCIKSHTNLAVNVRVQGGKDSVFAIGVSSLNNQSPLTELYKSGFGERFPIEKLKDLSPNLKGTIDLKNGQVTGVFTKIASTFYLSTNLLLPKRYKSAAKLAPDELAAMTLHEVGHVFAYYEFLATSTMTNHAMDMVAAGLRDQSDRVIRIQIIEAAADELGVKVDNAGKLADMKDSQAVQSVLINAAVESSRSATSARIYEYRGYEYLADQFATFQGAGKSLATALENFHAWELGRSNLQDRLTFMQMVTATLVAVGTVAILPVYLLLLAVPDQDIHVYDDPADRARRIKRNLVHALKDPTLTKVIKDEIVKDIDVIDGVIDRLAKAEPTKVFRFLWSNLTADRRNRQAQLQFQQRLESLASNDLFVIGQRFASFTPTR